MEARAALTQNVFLSDTKIMFGLIKKLNCTKLYYILRRRRKIGWHVRITLILPVSGRISCGVFSFQLSLQFMFYSGFFLVCKMTIFDEPSKRDDSSMNIVFEELTTSKTIFR